MAQLKGKALLKKAMIALLVMVPIIYGFLPEAYCSLEDNTVKYIYMSDSNKTVTKVLPDGDGWNIVDDRCQKGTNIGQWIRLNSETFKELNELIDNKATSVCNPIVLGYVDNDETGKTTKYFCDGIGINAECIEDNTLEMPWG